MNRIGTAASFARFLRDLYPLLRRPLTVEKARRVMRHRLDDRNGAWLRSVEQNVFANPRSPYLALLRRAGCELGDLTTSVRRSGLEPTLDALRSDGVYVSFEEFKGRAPIVRGDLVVHTRPEDFDNPTIRGAVWGASGGTTGDSTPVALTASRLAEWAPARLLAQVAHSTLEARVAAWRGFVFQGLIHAITDAAIGLPEDRWFAPTPAYGRLRTAGGRAAIGAIRAVARLAGSHVPSPEWTDMDDAVKVARWAAGAPAFLATGVSFAVRVASAGQEHGLDLSRLTIFASGEPPTPAKVTAIRAAGIHLVPHYAFTEGGRLAIGCAHAASDTDMHLFTDLFAVTRHRKRLDGSGVTVEPFAFTSLSPQSVKILLNFESDDYGDIEERACGCPFEGVGLRTHISNVYSHGRLTGEGVSLVGTQAQKILEEELPRRFGGTALDYQLAEEEDDAGLTRVVLIVSPRVDGDDAEIVRVFLETLGGSRAAADVRMIWQTAKTLRVRRSNPVATAAGKISPLAPPHISGRGKRR